MRDGTEQDTTSISARKAELRRTLRAARAERTTGTDPAAMTRLAERLAWWAMVRGAGTVAAYASYGNEPDSLALLDALKADSIRVLLPRWNADDSLDWTPYIDRASLVATARGPLEPDGPRYGAQALLGVDFVIVPALAVDRDGHRLGQGRGCYDRALTTLRSDVPILALLHDGELLPAGAVPHDEHDVKVTHVCMPSTGLMAVGAHEGMRPDVSG